MSNIMERTEIRQQIAEIEEKLSSLPQINPLILHHFSYGVYGREMRLNRGDLIVGKIHKFKNLNILSKGRVRVLSSEGIVDIEAPHTFVAPPGAKRVIFCVEDCVWTVIQGTSETDVEKIEEEFIAKNYGEIAGLDVDELALLVGGE